MYIIEIIIYLFEARLRSTSEIKPISENELNKSNVFFCNDSLYIGQSIMGYGCHSMSATQPQNI